MDRQTQHAVFFFALGTHADATPLTEDAYELPASGAPFNVRSPALDVQLRQINRSMPSSAHTESMVRSFTLPSARPPSADVPRESRLH